MTDYEVIKCTLGGQLLETMSTITFLGWMAGKLNGLQTTVPGLSELALMVKNPPMGKLSIETKIEVIRKLEVLGIEIK